MVPKKAQKVIYKMIKANEEQMKIFNQKGVRFEHLDTDTQLSVTNMIVLEQLNCVDFEKDLFQNEFSDCYILFITPFKIFEFLHSLKCTMEEKISFIDWYMDHFALFYKKVSFSSYAHAYSVMIKNIELFLKGKLEVRFLNNLIHINNKSSELFETYSFEKGIAEKIWTNSHYLYIPYTMQYEMLKKIGMPENLISELKKYNEENILSETDAAEKEIQAVAKKILTSPSEETQIVHLLCKKNQTYEKSFSEKEDNIEKRRLVDILKKYFYVTSLENVEII